jgi:hypothetical protein
MINYILIEGNGNAKGEVEAAFTLVSESVDLAGIDNTLNYTDFGEMELEQNIEKIIDSWEHRGFEYELLIGDRLTPGEPISGETLTGILEKRFIIRTGATNEIIDEPQPLGTEISDKLTEIVEMTIDGIIELASLYYIDNLTDSELYKFEVCEKALAEQMSEEEVICDYTLITNLPDWVGSRDSTVQLYLNYISEDMEIKFDQGLRNRTVYQRYGGTCILIKLKPVAAGYHETTKYNTITIWGRDGLGWTAYVTMLPTGYERWISDARTFLIANIGSTYAAETECSRILLTRGLAMMKLGNVCLIPFMYNQTEPSFDVVTQSKIRTEVKSEMLKAAKITDGAVSTMEGWEFRLFISMQSRADCSIDMEFTQSGKHIVVGGLEMNVTCAEILRLIRPVVNTTRLVYAYLRKMRCSKELILYTDQDVSTISIICHIPDQCRAHNMETYCYTQNHTPGRDRVKDYNRLLGRNKTAMHWGSNSQAQLNV